MKKNLTFFVLILIIAGYACNSEEANLTTEEVFAIRAVDVGNNHNASDLLTSFKVKNPSSITELRAFLINPADFPNYTSSKAGKLTRESYVSISNIATDNQVVLTANLKDVDGAAIIKDQGYFLGFVVITEDGILLNTQIAEAKITDAHFLDGRFGGTWDDNIYSGFGISADLKLQGNILSGPFWYSNNFLSCCGGQDDGRISMKIEEGDINSFRYDQKLVSFMGGPCDGTYTGEGQIENVAELVINFEGTDCEGPHTGGRIRLVKAQ